MEIPTVSWDSQWAMEEKIKFFFVLSIKSFSSYPTDISGFMYFLLTKPRHAGQQSYTEAGFYKFSVCQCPNFL